MSKVNEKEKPIETTVVEVEPKEKVEPVDKLAEDVEKATTEKQPNWFKRTFTKENLKNAGKTAGKVAIGVGIGIVGTIAAGLCLNRGSDDEEEYEDAEYECLPEETDEDSGE